MTDDRDIEAWKHTDLVDTARYDDAFFESLAGDIESALDVAEASNVVTLASRRPKWPWLVAVAAAAAMPWSILPRVPEAPGPVAISPENPTTTELAEAASPIAATHRAAAPSEIETETIGDSGADDELSGHAGLVAALAADFGLGGADSVEIEEEETLASVGSWVAELDDFTDEELALLVANL